MKLTTDHGKIDDSYNDAVLSTEEAVEVSGHGLIWDTVPPLAWAASRKSSQILCHNNQSPCWGLKLRITEQECCPFSCDIWPSFASERFPFVGTSMTLPCNDFPEYCPPLDARRIHAPSTWNQSNKTVKWKVTYRFLNSVTHNLYTTSHSFVLQELNNNKHDLPDMQHKWNIQDLIIFGLITHVIFGNALGIEFSSSHNFPC